MAWVDTVVAGTPEPRYGHGAVTAEGRIYVFGGTNGSGILFYVIRVSFHLPSPPPPSSSLQTFFTQPYENEFVRFLDHSRLSQFNL